MRDLLTRFRHRLSNRNEASVGKPDEVPQLASRDSSTTSTHHSGNARLGLFPLHLPKPADEDVAGKVYDADIIFIHGLNGGFESTWTHKNGTCWPRDLLPQALPGSRIFSYAYPSKIFAERSVATIRDFAQHLLSCLSQERSAERNGRPIVYICHSLGGIVFKKALILAKTVPEFEKIFQDSKIAVFMGTPHRGSPTATDGIFIGDIANLLFQLPGTRRVNTSLIQCLTQENQEIVEIGQDFVGCVSGLQIITFYETKAHDFTRDVIVGKTSAILGLAHEMTRPLFLNHHNICRFSGPEDTVYQEISRLIQSVIGQVLKLNETKDSSLFTDRSFDDTEKQLASMLNTVDIAELETKFKHVHVEGTLNWVLSNNQYQSWVSSSTPKVLWVTGFAGSGKSVLASYIMRHLTHCTPARALVCKFFCDNKVESLHDATILLQCLIYQLLDGRRRLWPLAKKALDTGGSKVFNQFDAMWNLFAKIVSAEQELSITIIVDAIDECDETIQALLVNRISELIGRDDLTTIRFFLTSRPNCEAICQMNVAAPRLIQLPLEQREVEISRDIELVIHNKLQRLIKRGSCRLEDLDTIKQLLLAKADRSFLWIELVLPLLEQRRLLHSSDVLEIISRLPSKLAAIYEHMLSSIPEDDQHVAAKMLRLLIASDRPLTGEEFGIMMVIGPEHESTMSVRASRPAFDEASARAVLGPLIRIHGSTIELVHQSLKDYLIALCNDPEVRLAATFGVNLRQEKLKVFYACSLYLRLIDFSRQLSTVESFIGDDSPTIDSPKPAAESTHSDDLHAFELYEEPMFQEGSSIEEGTWAKVVNHYKLFDYAALHWATDYCFCNEVASEQHNLAADALCKTGTAQLTNWFQYFWFKKFSPEPYPTTIDELMVFSFFGHEVALQRLLNDPILLNQDALNRALHWAARGGQVGCIKMLLKQPHIDTQASQVGGKTPLAIAADLGHFKCVSILTQDTRTDINARDSHGATPLSLAVCNNHTDIVGLLLLLKELSLNLPDNNMSTALHHAVATESYSIVSLLLSDTRLDKNHQDKRGRSAMSYAAEYGYTDIVERLTLCHDVDMWQKDSRGRSALSYAAQHGHLKVVKILVQSKRVDLCDVDNEQRNAHSWAASQRGTKVLSYLLKYCHNGIDIQDQNGWTPLFWALETGGYVENVRAILEAGGVDVNHKDHEGRTALSWAAGYGYTEIVRLLVDTNGIQLESRDIDNGTPLSKAASCGHVDVVHMLLDTHRVDVNAKDIHGRTALWKAARAGRVEVVRTLLLNAAIDRHSKDNTGQTPAEVAKAFEREDVVSLLQHVS